ncbi:MAG: ABC transporter permease [Bacteroidia bacterium]|nr:ABC transporter permease [Bacteroidia bacterium]
MSETRKVQYFFRNYPAVAGLIYFLVWILAAFFAYFIITDSSPNAGTQYLSVAKKPPFTSLFFLRIKPEKSTDNTGWVQKLWSGKPQEDTEIPLLNKETLYRNDTLYATLYSGQKLQMYLPASRSFSVQQKQFLLGSDTFGRDVWSRLVLGARVSISVGLLATLLSVFTGLVIGLTAGFFGGLTDRILMAFIAVVWAIPTLLLAIVLGFVMGMGFWQLMLAIGLSNWVDIARMVRGQVMGIRNLLYIEATNALGLGQIRVMFRHILPNIVSPLIIMGVSNFGSAILVESGLSFLGLGVGLEVPSWGRMVFEGYPYLVMENGRSLALIPGIALILLVISIHLIGNGLRDTFALEK